MTSWFLQQRAFEGAEGNGSTVATIFWFDKKDETLPEREGKSAVGV